MPQTFPSHVAAPFAGIGQGAQRALHESGDVSLLQLPPQSCVPAGHAQVPAWHVIPPLHAIPQPPQFLLSLP
jgi:hypothetical protein